MGTFFEDWSSYAVASGVPSGYTALQNSAFGFGIESVAEAPSGKALRFQAQGDSTDPAHRQVITADALSTQTGDYEVTAQVRVGNVPALNLFSPGPVVRAVSQRAVEQGMFRNTDGTTRRLDLRWVDGTTNGEVVAAQTFSWDPATNYWIRVKVTGMQVQARTWLASGTEPATWQFDATATSTHMAASGVPGLGQWLGNAEKHWVLAWGVGWAGDAAPLTGAPETPTGLTVTQQGTGLRSSWTSTESEFILQRERWTGSGSPA